MRNNNELEINIGTAQAESNTGKQTSRGVVQLRTLMLFGSLVLAIAALAQDVASPPAMAGTGIPSFTTRARQHEACRTIEVMRFGVGPGVDFSEGNVSALMVEVISRLSQTHKFEAVLAQGQKTTGAAPPCMRLTGIVTEFKKGNRATRYFAGPATGKTLVKAHVRFLYSPTGKLLNERDVDGTVRWGVFGGSSTGADRGVAKEIAKVAEKVLLVREEALTSRKRAVQSAARLREEGLIGGW
jgi:hypothetical protein